jgi:hypothetical protein
MSKDQLGGEKDGSLWNQEGRASLVGKELPVNNY